MSDLHKNPTHRHDFVLYFDCTDGNPNGDPDAGNQPRVDPETMQGLVTDVALKRKVRDWVAAAQSDESRFKIYVEQYASLNAQHKRAYAALGESWEKPDRLTIDRAKAWMCQNFFDVRLFGAVMSTGVNCGQVRGPVQLTFARSVDPVTPLDVTITRVAVTREDADKETEMGRKAMIPYGLYRAHGFYTPQFGQDTGVDEEDLGLIWRALVNMWDFDRSAARGMMACRGLYVFSHENKLGNAPAHQLFERVRCARKEEIDAPRKFDDYVMVVDGEGLPDGVTLTRVLG